MKTLVLYSTFLLTLALTGCAQTEVSNVNSARSKKLDQQALELLEQRRTNPKKLEEAKDLLTKAIRQDHSNAIAHARLAETYTLLVGYGLLAQDRGLPLARKHGAIATELLPNHSYVQRVGFRVALYVDLDVLKARATVERMIQKNPSDQSALFSKATLLYFHRSFDQGERVLDKIKRINPSIPEDRFLWFYYYSKKYNQCQSSALRILSGNPQHKAAKRQLAKCLVQTQGYAEAKQLFWDLGAKKANAPLSLYGDFALAMAKSGELQQAKAIYDEIQRRAKSGEALSHLRQAQLASVLGLGQDKVEYLLKRAIQTRDPFILWINIDPYFDRFRAAPFFRRILKQLQLEG